MSVPMGGGIEGLEEAVMEEARERVREILSDAETRAEQLRQRAERDVDVQRQAIVERAQAKAAAVRNDAIAEGHLQAQNYKLKQREILLEQVFAQARDCLATVVDREDYPDLVKTLIREALMRLGAEGSFRVRLGERTAGFIDNAVLAAIAADLDVTLQRGESLSQREGVLVETLDGHRQYDNTLVARWERMQETLRAPVFHRLMGKAP